MFRCKGPDPNHSLFSFPLSHRLVLSTPALGFLQALSSPTPFIFPPPIIAPLPPLFQLRPCEQSFPTTVFLCSQLLGLLILWLYPSGKIPNQGSMPILTSQDQTPMWEATLCWRKSQRHAWARHCRSTVFNLRQALSAAQQSLSVFFVNASFSRSYFLSGTTHA